MTQQLQSRSASPGLDRALETSLRLLVTAEAHAMAMADLGMIDLPPIATVQPMQLRAVASLYLASTLEGAGLMDVADDFVRLARSGVIKGDLQAVGEEIAAYWQQRGTRIAQAERVALFARLFGAPAGPVDSMGGVNSSFDERILDLCDAIIAAAEGGPQTRVRRAGERLAENIGQVVNDTVLMMAREIMGDLAEAVSILGNAEVRAALGARGLWDVVAAIDRLMRRPRRPTLSHLRRGRAGMTVLAWLADMLDGSRDGGVVVEAEDSVVSAAVDWVDETLTLVQSEMGEPTSSPARPQPSWADLAR